MTRREWLSAAAAAAVASTPVKAAPTSPVAVARCTTYGPQLTPVMARMFDQLGGLGSLVKGKTVAIKINLTGAASYRLGHTPAELAHWTHPRVIGTTIHLLHKAGARRVRILECPWSTAEPLPELMLEAGWEPLDIFNAGGMVEFENTNYLGLGKQYHRLRPANGGHLFSEYWLNHSYEDCDVFVSIAKMKEHATAGITLSMKNLFGITPCTIYGDGANEGEPLRFPQGGRGTVFHRGARQPANISVRENDPKSPRYDGYRIPRAVADLVSARPIHLAILDGIATMAGGEGPWIGGSVAITPGILMAGLNCVTTDAVGTAAMGYDPMAERGTPPFQRCDSTLKLAEQHGVGTRDLSQIEVVGLPVERVRFEFAKHRAPGVRSRI
jgi:uncharacterized protein (DUF362 family)